jgi:hypothetical protein
LKLALDALQSRGHNVVWVDALCINQQDEVERAKQILRMKDIYSTARDTVVWLGPDEDGIAELAFSHLNWVSVHASGEQLSVHLNSLMPSFSFKSQN